MTAAGRLEIAAQWLVLGVLILLPVGRISELPVLIACIGAFLLVALLRGHAWNGTAARSVLLLFASYWLPILFSAFDAVNPHKTWMVALETLRFLPFALFVAWALRDADAWQRCQLAIAAVVGLWLLDAWVQMATGYSLAGAAEQERLAGIFGADNLKLGPALAALSPFFLHVARERTGRWGLLLAFLLMLAPILLAGSRAAWLTFALVTCVFAWRETRSLRRFLPLLLGVVLGIVFSIGMLWKESDGFQARIERSLLVFNGNAQAIDQASAWRLSIWAAAIDMIRAHPLNGVGARGFRNDYAEHARGGDPFVDAKSGEGAAHAHQIVLEVLSETGIIGLLCWIFGSATAIRMFRRATPAQRQRAFVPALALVVTCNPLNTHLAFYSAWWGLFFWWLLALYCAAFSRVAQQADGDAGDHQGRADQPQPQQLASPR